MKIKLVSLKPPKSLRKVKAYKVPMVPLKFFLEQNKVPEELIYIKNKMNKEKK